MNANDIANLPHELRVSHFAKLAGVAPRTVRQMIADGILRARPMVPGVKRPTHLIQSEQLYGLLGIERGEAYVSRRLR